MPYMAGTYPIITVREPNDGETGLRAVLARTHLFVFGTHTNRMCGTLAQEREVVPLVKELILSAP